MFIVHKWCSLVELCNRPESHNFFWEELEAKLSCVAFCLHEISCTLYSIANLLSNYVYKCYTFPKSLLYCLLQFVLHNFRSALMYINVMHTWMLSCCTKMRSKSHLLSHLVSFTKGKVQACCKFNTRFAFIIKCQKTSHALEKISYAALLYEVKLNYQTFLWSLWMTGGWQRTLVNIWIPRSPCTTNPHILHRACSAKIQKLSNVQRWLDTLLVLRCALF